MPSKNFQFLKNGFTLIEIMVALGIMALIGAVALPNLRNFSRTREIEDTASGFINVLKMAQSSAASRIKCPSGEAAVNWQVILNTSTASDSYTLVCQASAAQTVFTSPFAPAPANSSTFQATTIPCAGENMTIYYTNLQTSYKCASNPSPLLITSDITITLSPSNPSKQIVIEPGGTIR